MRMIDNFSIDCHTCGGILLIQSCCYNSDVYRFFVFENTKKDNKLRNAFLNKSKMDLTAFFFFSI